MYYSKINQCFFKGILPPNITLVESDYKSINFPEPYHLVIEYHGPEVEGFNSKLQSFHTFNYLFLVYPEVYEGKIGQTLELNSFYKPLHSLQAMQSSLKHNQSITLDDVEKGLGEAM